MVLLLIGVPESVNRCFSAPYVDIQLCFPFFSLFYSSFLPFGLSFGNCRLVFDFPVYFTMT